MPQDRYFRYVLSGFFLLSVFVLAIIRIEDPDVWIHLSFGRLIWNLRGFPAEEPFLYAMRGEPFSYSSWLFGLVLYAAYHAVNIYGVILLKAATVTTVFFILLRDSLRPYNNTVVSVFVLSLVVIMTRFRFVERPDTFMMVFLAFSIFSLNAFILGGKKYLYALPLVHMLWANSHSSIILMFVPFVAFLAGGILARYAAAKNPRFVAAPTTAELKTIAWVFLASFAASLVSPYGTGQYLFGPRFLSATDWYSQNIAELAPPTWKTMRWPFIVAPMIFLSFLLNAKRVSLVHVLLVIPFIVISFVAGRFAVVSGIVAGPVIARNIGAYLSDKTWREKVFSGRVAAFAALIWTVLYASLIFARVEPFVDTRVVDAKDFGFGINYDCYPEKALRYMDRRHISGRIFNTFGWGQYIIFRDFPARKPFVDGRGYLPPDLLQMMDRARYEPEILDELYRIYGFESILVDYPSAESAFLNFGNNQALSHPGWALVYWDDLALLYVRRGGPYDFVIKEDEYRFINPANNILSTRSMLESEESRAGLVKELERNIADSGSSKAYAFLGSVYNGMGEYQKAVEAFSHVRPFPAEEDHMLDRYMGMGYAYARMGRLDDALRTYKESLCLPQAPAVVYFNIGNIYFRKQDKKNARIYLEKAVKIDGTIASAYPLLITLYREENRVEDARQMEERYRSALLLKESEEHDVQGRLALSAGRLDAAIEEFKKAVEISPSNAEASSNLGRAYYTAGVMSEAAESLERAITIDPNHAISYYWLGQVYKSSGNAEMARTYFEKYRRLEPGSYLSRTAK